MNMYLELKSVKFSVRIFFRETVLPVAFVLILLKTYMALFNGKYFWIEYLWANIKITIKIKIR